MASFFFSTDYYSPVYVNHIVVIQSLFADCVGCFHFLGIMNRTAVNMPEQVEYLSSIQFFDHMPRKGLAGSYDQLIFYNLKDSPLIP